MTSQELEQIDHYRTSDKRVMDMALNCWVVYLSNSPSHCKTCGRGYCKYNNSHTNAWQMNDHIQLLVDKLQ